METNKKQVYLENGQLADLISEIEGNYLVAPHYYYEGAWYGDEQEESYSSAGHNMIFVEKIFDKPPVAHIEEEYQRIISLMKDENEKLSLLKGEHRKLEMEVNALKNQRTDLVNMIINRSELKGVKTLWAFPVGHFLPKEYTAAPYDGFKFSFSFETYKGEKGGWITSLDSDGGRYTSSDTIDSKFGLLINKTEEEIREITKERIALYPSEHFKQYGRHRDLEKVDDYFLTPQLIAIKKQQIEDRKNEEKAKKEKEVEELKQKLEKLTQVK